MKIIVGLGNPGKIYQNTRHNSGYLVLDQLASKLEIGEWSKNKKFQADLAEANKFGEKIILVKPTTFMNLSGNAVARLMTFYKVKPEDLIVISDDVDLPLDKIRIRKMGTSGGHQGLQSIIDSIGTNKFIRLRLGIARPIDFADRTEAQENRMQTAEYVLEPYSRREKAILAKTLVKAVKYIIRSLKASEFIDDTI